MDRILYNGISLPPYEEHFLNRPQINDLLEKAVLKPIVTVVGGAGFGKTQAVSAFLRQRKANVTWIQISTIDNIIIRFWEHFVYSLSLHNKELASTFTMLGFPENAATFSAFLQLIADGIKTNGDFFLVCDDFHLIHEKGILFMIEELAHARIAGLSIILISRSVPPIGTVNLMVKGLLENIDETHLQFSKDEMSAYFAMKNLKILERAISEIYSITNGWAFAIHLIGLTLKQGIVYDKVPISLIKFDMYKLIDAELFSRTSKELQVFLVKLSLIDNLRAELLQALSMNFPELINELMNLKSFIQYDSYANCYHIHTLLLDFLKEKQSLLSRDEIQEVHRKAASWYIENGYKIDAVTHYEKAGDYEKIVVILSGILNAKLADFILETLDRMPADVWEQMPMLKIIRAKTLVSMFRLEEAIEILIKLKHQYEALPLSNKCQTLLGEVYCMLGYISLITSLADRNYQFVDFFKKADKYLPDGSMLFDNNVHFNKGTYACMISAAHYQEGTFDQYTEAMLTAIPYASRVMNGNGCGAEHLLMTEVAYFKRDFKNTQKYAQQAIYASQEKDQYDIECMATFYLIRVYAALCNYSEIKSLIGNMTIQADKRNNMDFYIMLHIAEGWFYATIGQTEKVQDWIVEEADDYSGITDISFSLYHLVRAKCNLVQKKYYEILAFTNQQNNPYGLHNFLIGAVEIKVLRAVTLYIMNEKESALRVLEEAYTLAHPNGLIMPFIEHGTHMRTLTKFAINSESCSIPIEWLENIQIKSSSYAKKIYRIRAEYQASQNTTGVYPALTHREMEVLSNLCNGLTREEISDECNLSVNTIKSMLQNIYAKLGAMNSYDAVRIAAQMNLKF